MLITTNILNMFSDNKKLIFLQGIMLFVFFILIALLILQNLHLKKTQSIKKNNESNDCKSLYFEAKLKKHFLFKALPFAINPESFLFNEKNKIGDANGYVMILFDLTVCGRCLTDELRILESYKEIINSKNIVILGIIGIVNKREESEIINHYRSGIVFFPFKFVDVESLYATFHLSKENFLDTPFYVFASHTLKVLDIFKPNYMDTTGLEKWLETITDQEMF